MTTRSEAMDTTPRGTLGIELIIVRSLFPVFPRRALYMQTWCVGGLDRRRRNCSLPRSPENWVTNRFTEEQLSLMFGNVGRLRKKLNISAWPKCSTFCINACGVGGEWFKNL